MEAVEAVDVQGTPTSSLENAVRTAFSTAATGTAGFRLSGMNEADCPGSRP